MTEPLAEDRISMLMFYLVVNMEERVPIGSNKLSGIRSGNTPPPHWKYD